MKVCSAILGLLLVPCLTGGCGESPKGGTAAGTVKAEEKGWTVTDWSEWKQQDTGPEAKVSVVADLPETKPVEGRPPLSAEAQKAGVLVLERGEPFTVVRYEGKAPLLVDEYEISWDAMRVDGNDFFASLTFPVGSKEQCATFVTGGWGGWTTGISSIGHQFANENETSGSMEFATGRWYTFTLQVNIKCLRGLIDGKEQFKVGLKGKTIGMHPSEITKSMPLGFASYSTKGAIRNVRVRPLKAGELVPPVEAE
ncbi:MAG: hypothetical protein V4675_12280 [Verrucomicrobiota bacterium]